MAFSTTFNKSQTVQKLIPADGNGTEHMDSLKKEKGAALARGAIDKIARVGNKE